MSEQEYSIERILEDRDNALEVLSKDSTNVEASIDLVCADTLLCEDNLLNQGMQWRNYYLCKEIEDHILPVIHSQDPEEYELGIQVCMRAADALPDHPRLKWRLLKFALDTRLSNRMEPDYDLEGEINYLVRNINHSDNGQPEKIQTLSHLKVDPVEWSKEYENVIHLAQEKAIKELKDAPSGMGFCHAYWPVLRNVLLQDYGINWKHPAMMNPRVVFD